MDIYKKRERDKRAQKIWRDKPENKAKHLAAVTKAYRFRVYGMTDEKLEKLKELQDNKCALCGKEAKLEIDHCHETGKVRGLLCGQCNRTIGYWERRGLEKLNNYLTPEYGGIKATC